MSDETESSATTGRAGAPAVDQTTIAPAAPVAPDTVDDVIEAWFRRHFFSLGAGISEETYNRIHAAKEDLKSSLAGCTMPVTGSLLPERN